MNIKVNCSTNNVVFKMSADSFKENKEILENFLKNRISFKLEEEKQFSTGFSSIDHS